MRRASIAVFAVLLAGLSLVDAGAECVGQNHTTVVADVWFVLIALFVHRRKAFRREIFAQFEDRVEGFTGVLGEPFPLRERLDVEPFVEQEFQITFAKHSLIMADEMSDVNVLGENDG